MYKQEDKVNILWKIHGWSITQALKFYNIIMGDGKMDKI